MSNLITYSELGNVVWIDGVSYLISRDSPTEGDIIMDRRNGSYDICVEVVDNYVVFDDIREAIPIESVYKLIPFNPENN